MCSAPLPGRIEEQGLFLKATSALVGAGEGVKVRFPTGAPITRWSLESSSANFRHSRKRARSITSPAAASPSTWWCATEDRSFRKSIDTYASRGRGSSPPTRSPIPVPALLPRGERRDQAEIEYRIHDHDIERQIAWAWTWYPLYPGDIIMTGTCEGVSRVCPAMSCIARSRRSAQSMWRSAEMVIARSQRVPPDVAGR